METLHGWLSIPEVAERLAVSRARVHQLIRSDALPAVRPGRDVLVPFSAVEELLHLRPPPGRPLSQAAAWREIASTDFEAIAEPEARDQWRRRMRARAEWRRFRIHPSGLDRFRSSAAVVLSGPDATAAWHHPIDPDPDRVIGYAMAVDIDTLVGQLHLKPNQLDWNVELGVVADQTWPYGRILNHVSERVCWLDLADHRHRAEDILRAVVFSRPSNTTRLTEFRQQLLDRGALTINQLTALRNEHPSDTEQYVEQWISEHRIIVVEHDGERLIPARLLDPAHRPDGFWTPIIAALKERGFEPWAIWAWIDAPTSFLTGQIPTDIAATDPARVRTALENRLRSLDG